MGQGAKPSGGAGAESPGAAGQESSVPARSPFPPRDPEQSLAEWEVAAILEHKRQHPLMGPAQIRAQLKRFKGWRISIRAIRRVLRAHGYESVRRGGRP